MKLFTERYKELLCEEDEESKTGFCENDEISYENRRMIENLMFTYNEPHQVRISRYTDETEEMNAVDMAIAELNDILGYNRIIASPFDDYPIAVQPTPFLFDLLEIQYKYLSHDEQISFSQKLNELFKDLEINWILHDGLMIKVDAEQFDFDMRIKALQELHKLKEEESKFQSVYDELYSAGYNLEKGDYVEAINWAGKSYESMLKILLKTDRGNASNLTQKYVEEIIDLPDNANLSGFREKVLMSLPYIRNSYSAHGAGESNITISKALAHLAVNLASSLDTYLIEEYKYGKQVKR